MPVRIRNRDWFRLALFLRFLQHARRADEGTQVREKKIGTTSESRKSRVTSIPHNKSLATPCISSILSLLFKKPS